MQNRLFSLSIIITLFITLLPMHIQSAAPLPENENITKNTNTALSNVVAKQAAALVNAQQVPSADASTKKAATAATTPHYRRPKWIDENGNLHHWELGGAFWEFAPQRPQ